MFKIHSPKKNFSLYIYSICCGVKFSLVRVREPPGLGCPCKGQDGHKYPL